MLLHLRTGANEKSHFGPQCVTSPCNYTVRPLGKLASEPGELPGALLALPVSLSQSLRFLDWFSVKCVKLGILSLQAEDVHMFCFTTSLNVKL